MRAKATTDDDALAPAAMTGFERGPHDIDIAGAVEGVVCTADLVRAPLRHADQMRHQIARDGFRVDEMRHAEPIAPGFLVVVDVSSGLAFSTAIVARIFKGFRCC